MPTHRELLEPEDAERIGDLTDIEVKQICTSAKQRTLRVGVENESRE